ncbi:GntR family transcriptional regulator [Vibrio quintilis]|uniref:Bacterial regulatory proteins, gntR family n=1 Tax=Vibrio quintilis TaxID=1117707 RepID=A0A1M7YSF3_9VIBR|nr:GntR family transcriptional regulator [Vibrio quintilis]SHO55551.1 Bacterial regulatory proteins, gntR family [Vibrio quintilis]
MERIDFTNTKDEVAEIIKREIISGNITNQHTITQNYLAEQFGLSRMPIREAFNTLIQEGLIIKLNNRKLKVVDINARTLTIYNQMLSASECALLMSFREDKPVYQTLSEQLHTSGNPQQDLIAFHHALSAMTKDDYTRHLHLSMLNVFWMHSIRYCHPDYAQSVSYLEKALKLLHNEAIDEIHIQSLVAFANQTILNAIK